MPWYLHGLWALVIYFAAVRVGHGIATAGEWVAKAMMKNSETIITWEREKSLRRGKG